MRAVALVLAVAVTMLATGEAASRKAKSYPVIEAMATCAVEKNAGDVTWAYILQSGQSGLSGPTLDGANLYALALMVRDCAAGRVSFDNDQAVALSNAAFTAWRGDRTRASVPRAIDAWADCLADNETRRARAYLSARDWDFTGPKVIIEGVDPVEAIFAPSLRCDASRPADRSAITTMNLYARLNYRLRVQPRLGVKSSAAAAKNEAN